MDVVTKATATVAPVDDSMSEHGEFDVILSTAALDRDGDELRADEWKTPLPERIHFDSDHGMSVESTVGSGRPFINGDGQLQVRGTYASTQHAQNVRRLVNEGHVRHVSVAFMNRKSKKDATVERELLSGGFVAVPANEECVVLGSKGAGGGHNKKEPYGSVQYADPGFRNDVKRYPINTPEHVRAAWDYFHHAGDRDKYSSAEQHHIEDEIRTAAKKFGIKLEGSDDSKKSVDHTETTKGHWCDADSCCQSKAVKTADGASDANDKLQGVQAVLRNVVTQLSNGNAVEDAPSTEDDYYQKIHDAAVQLGGSCAAVNPAEGGHAWGADSPHVGPPPTKSLSDESADAADPTAFLWAAGLTAPTDQTDIELARAKALAIELS